MKHEKADIARSL